MSEVDVTCWTGAGPVNQQSNVQTTMILQLPVQCRYEVTVFYVNTVDSKAHESMFERLLR